jgi:hypothetical protein
MLPQEKRSFVGIGDVARIELDDRPEHEALDARIVQIGRDVAVPDDVPAALAHAAAGDAAYRVELELLQRNGPTPPLHPGTMATVRFRLGDERLLDVVFARMRRWTDRS